MYHHKKQKVNNLRFIGVGIPATDHPSYEIFLAHSWKLLIRVWSASRITVKRGKKDVGQKENDKSNGTP